MLKKRLWLLALIVFIFSCGTVFWIILQHSAAPRKSSGSSVNSKQMSFDEAEGVSMKVAGAKSSDYWELQINKIESLGSEDILNQVQGTYYVNKSPFYKLSGDTGTVDLKTRVIKVNGHVILRTVDASKELNTAELIWDSLLNRITARQGAILKTPQATVNTEQIISNLKMDHAEFTGSTKVSCQRINR